MKYRLSFLIPARQEEFLGRTVQDILENTSNESQVIVGLDGYWPEPGIPDDPRLTLVYYPEALGQRALTNQLCKISTAKYVAKVDAHTSFDKGWDTKMFQAFEKVGDNVTMVSIMRNLWVFDWKCPDGHKRYQGISGTCKEKIGGTDAAPVLCGKETKKDICWIAKSSPQSKSYCFDSTPHFQYYGEYCKTPQFKKDLEETGLTETMSLQGSCFMLTREKYWELGICDENMGSWGSQGLEVACKTWLSGGRVLVNHNTYYGHLFRTAGGDFSFPYPQSGRGVEKAKKFAKDLFFTNSWKKQTRPLSWLIDHFYPVKGWNDEDIKRVREAGKSFVTPLQPKVPTKGIIFYTDNQCPLKIAHRVQKQLRSIGLPIVSASLKPMPNMGTNICLPLKRGYLTMFKQILSALESSTADIVFFCEHDVFYHPSHFDFTPEDKETFYYNVNVWKVRAEDGHALYVDNCRQVSGICVYREAAIIHYKERVKWVEEKGYTRNMGFEPETHGRIFWEHRFKTGSWKSVFPNLDIRHKNNLTPNRWDPSLFRDKRCCRGWTEKNVKELEGWSGLDHLI
jgi:hypothetical protein